MFCGPQHPLQRNLSLSVHLVLPMLGVPDVDGSGQLRWCERQTTLKHLVWRGNSNRLLCITVIFFYQTQQQNNKTQNIFLGWSQTEEKQERGRRGGGQRG